MLTDKETTKLGVPPGFKDRYVVRLIEATFGLSKAKNNPMISVQAEVVGVPTTQGITCSIVKRGGVDWQIAGIRVNTSYFPLVAGPSLSRFFAFHDALNLPHEVDENNPNVEQYKGKLVEAILTTEESVERKVLSDDEKAAGKTMGDPILDNDGKEIKTTRVVVSRWLAPYRGDVAEPF